MNFLLKYLLKSSILLVLLVPNIILAATLTISPETGVYTLGSTFSVNVRVNTAGSPINAADGTIKFDPSVLNVVSANRSSSIFNLWVTEPTFSNSNGTINFSGGVPAGYSGSTGTILNITFRTVSSGVGRVSFTNGSVLANDGRGTNVLTDMRGGSFTVSPQATAPEPEIVEYIAPANTPSAPVVDSTSHEDPTKWYRTNQAVLSWTIPTGVTAMRTLLNDRPSSVPTVLYETPIEGITIDDLPEGESYFHIQFRNTDGWGGVTSYRLASDNERPESLEISFAEGVDGTHPNPLLKIEVADKTSGVEKLRITIDDLPPYEIDVDNRVSTVTLPTLAPGFHSVNIDAIDRAGNELSKNISFTTEAFGAPVFINLPVRVNEGTIPVIVGETRKNSEVTIEFGKIGTDLFTYVVSSDDSGVFNFIPEVDLSSGVYEIRAMTTDSTGAVSEWSNTFKILVELPGYLKIGNFLVNTLSVVVSMVGIVLLLIMLVWYCLLYIKKFRKKVSVESHEALSILDREFEVLHTKLREQEASLIGGRKSKKLTNAEESMIKSLDVAMQESQKRVQKEIEDVTDIADHGGKSPPDNK